MVGTDIGNTYKGRQGTGFATIAPYNPNVDLSIAEMQLQKEQLAAQEKAAREKKLMDAYSQMSKIKPDNWYVHDKQVSELVGGAIDLGATLLQRGEDPFTGQSDDAINFNKLLTGVTKYTEYSKQFQKDFSEAQKAFKNGEEIENWDDIVTWFHNPDLLGMSNGDYGLQPKPIFKKPEVSTFRVMNEYWDKWRINNKERVPSMSDASLMAKEILNDPTVSQGFASTGSKLKQRYDSLPEEQREALTARGASNGGNDGYTQYVAEQMYALSNPSFSLEEEVMKLAKEVGTSVSTVESGDTTIKNKYAKMSEKDLRNVVRSALQDGAVQREVAAGKYGNPNKDIAYNLKAAEDYYYPLLKKNISTEYSKTTDEAGKGKKEFEAASQQWLLDIRGANGKAAQDNARERLRGITLPGGEVTLTFGDERDPDSVGDVMVLASEKVSDNPYGNSDKKMTSTPINIKEADDEQLLRYLYESDKLRGKPYKPLEGGTETLYKSNATTEDLY